jgi:hypothetical protein
VTFESSSSAVSYSYIPDSTGFLTATYSKVATPDGYITYASVPTSSGISEYTEDVSTVTTPKGATVTYTIETNSLG